MLNNYYGIIDNHPLHSTESLQQCIYNIDFIKKNIDFFCSNPIKMMEELNNIEDNLKYKTKQLYSYLEKS